MQPVIKSIPLSCLGLLALLTCFAGCAAIPVQTSNLQPPDVPRVTQKTAESQIKRMTPPRTEGKLPDFSRLSLGVNDFDGDNKGGPLLTNNLWRSILPRQQAGQIKVVDRSRITEVVKELERTNSSWINLSETEKAKRVGQLIQADYLIYASLTEYRSDEKTIDITPEVKDDEIERYKREYKTYSDQVDKKIADLKVQAMLLPQAQMEISKLEMARQNARPEAIIQMAKMQTGFRQTTETVSSVGITLRMIEVKTGQTQWIFECNARNTSLDQASQNLIEVLMTAMFAGTQVAKLD